MDCLRKGLCRSTTLRPPVRGISTLAASKGLIGARTGIHACLSALYWQRESVHDDKLALDDMGEDDEVGHGST